MEHYMFLGVDDHKDSVMVKKSLDRSEQVWRRKFSKTLGGYEELRRWGEEGLPEGTKIIAAYEAGPSGPQLARELTKFGWTCWILAPHAMGQSAKDRKQKSDPKDAHRILELVRGHVLAGNRLTTVWIPDEELLDHRELVRERLDLGEKIGELKNQIHGFLRRHAISRPSEIKSLWTKKHLRWLESLQGQLKWGAAIRMESLVGQLGEQVARKARLDLAIEELSKQARYQKACEALRKIRGVGLLTSMVYLTEMGEMTRFKNRRNIASYVGLCPSQYETGESGERKGRITRYGPSRIRKMLNQAAWAITRMDPNSTLAVWYRGLAIRRGKKKAIVAVMRRLAIQMWHIAVSHAA